MNEENGIPEHTALSSLQKQRTLLLMAQQTQMKTENRKKMNEENRMF